MACHVRVGTTLLHGIWHLAHQSGLRVMNAAKTEGAIKIAERKRAGGIVPSLPARLTARALIGARRFVIDDGHAMRFDNGEERAHARDLGPHGAAAIEMGGDVAAPRCR